MGRVVSPELFFWERVGALDQHQGGPGPVFDSAWQLHLACEPVTAETPLEKGDAIIAEQCGQWWDAEVIQVKEDGSVRAHYIGWANSWDETLPRSRIRLRTSRQVPIRIVLEGGTEMKGTLLDATSGFLLFKREGGGKLLVNPGKIIYLELLEEAS